MKNDKRDQTIRDFGDQWTRYTDNEGYYGSSALLRDMVDPLINVEDLKDKRVAEIGSGTGRIVKMLLNAGVSHITALEPSDAMKVLRENTAAEKDRIQYVNETGERLPDDDPFDYVFSIGVLHHIPDPDPVVKAAYSSLKEGGRFVAWLYGKEGNAAYLAFVLPLRKLTSRMPHPVLRVFSAMLNFLLGLYIGLARVCPVPLRGYMVEVIGKFSREKRYLVIYDQLNPAYAKYYSRAEAEDLLASAGFADVRTHHRHGYSWTVVGTKKSGTSK